jgi:hypothetical protein
VLYPGVFPHLAALTAARADLVAILLTGLPAGIVPGFQNSTGNTPAGALVVHATEPLLGREIEASSPAAGASRVHALVHQRRAGDRPLFAAVFPALAQGDYELWEGGRTVGRVKITGGRVTEVALRSRPGCGGRVGPPEIPRSPVNR